MRETLDTPSPPGSPYAGSSAQASAKPGLLECIFATFALLTFSRWMAALLSADIVGQYDGSALARSLLLAMIYLIALSITLIYHRQELVRLAFRNKLLIVVVGYAVLSSLWAIDPSASLRRSIALCMSLTFAFYLVIRFPLLRILEFALISIIIVASSTLLTELAAGGIFDADNRRWGTVGITANSAGRIFAVGALLAVALWRSPWLFQRFDMAVLALILFCLAGVDAITATVSMFAGIGSYLILTRSMPSANALAVRIIAAALIVIPIALVALNYFDEILGYLGRDSTLTHRTYIWEAALEKGPPNDIIGAGYRSFWVPSHYITDVWYNVFGSANTEIGNGHSGYIDTWLELGWIGVGLIVALFVQMALRCFTGVAYFRDPAAAFFMALLAFGIVDSITDRFLLEHSELVWMLFMVGIIGLSQRRRQNIEQNQKLANFGLNTRLSDQS